MRQNQFLLFGLGLTFIAGPALAQPNPTNRPPPVSGQMISVNTTNYLGLVTNGPAMVHLYQITQSWTNPTPVTNPIMATNPYFMKMRQSNFSWTNAVFDSFIPGSLNYTIWTNFLALTNGRTLHLWTERTHPEGWPTNKPLVRWNTNNVMWGMQGLTALSPCWQGEGSPGQVPFSALTRRHAYTRGHGMGPEGFQTLIARHKVWFLTRDNVLVEAIIKRHVTRASLDANGGRRDYTVVLFDRDLPESIEPLRVVMQAEIQSKYPFPGLPGCPQPIFQTEQGGYVSTGIAPLVVNTWKPGDSGAPNLIPLPGEVIFFSGRSTTGPSREMQQDMDELCRLEKLKPEKYQMRKADLSKYSAF
jgi:hypothetical protein